MAYERNKLQLSKIPLIAAPTTQWEEEKVQQRPDLSLYVDYDSCEQFTDGSGWFTVLINCYGLCTIYLGKYQSVDSHKKMFDMSTHM